MPMRRRTGFGAFVGSRGSSGALLFGLLVGALAGCRSTPEQITVTTDPPGATIRVDGQNLGASPVQFTVGDIDARGKIVVTATMQGHLTEQAVLSEDSPALRDGHLALVLAADEAYSATTTNEATNNWLRVQVDPAIPERDVWQRLVDSITSRYSSVEQLDDASGYIRTIFVVKRFQGSRGSLEIRNRLIATIASRNPLVYKFKIESDASDGQGNHVPYDRVFKEDAALIEEIQSRLGAK